jgi:hypothetical protein
MLLNIEFLSALFYFLTASLAPQTEHFPSAVIFGCSLTSAPHKPHFKALSPPVCFYLRIANLTEIINIQLVLK